LLDDVAMKKSNLALGFAVVAALAAAACSSADDSLLRGSAAKKAAEAPTQSPPGAAAGSNDVKDPAIEVLPDPFEGLPRGAEQLTKVCARGQHDMVTKALCGNPSISSVVELQEALGLGFVDRSDQGQNASSGNPAFALSGHSSSLVMREVSAINPRAFLFSPTPGQPVHIPGYVVMGFARGEPFVEIAAEDPNTRALSFYLVKFDLACGTSCKPGDLLTPAVEKNWTGWTLYQDEDLKNTITDCRQCHQPEGPSSKPMLRMQELKDPWTHWFRNDRPGGIALIQDFARAHGTDEDYFGIPATILQLADGRAMEDFVTGQGFGNQPNSFDSKQIEQEVRSSASEQPSLNFPKGQSSTWQRLYDSSAAGSFIPVPYHDVKVTDPNKLEFAIEQYKAVKAGTVPAANLPDIRRVFLDDALEEMSMRPRTGASGREVLIQACAQCHNSRLDQSISRAKFDVTQLDTMSDAEKAVAIARMKLPANDRLHMPPALFRTLPDEALNAAVSALQ
jgi:mono/diheme cytochrome c family protein